jgi:hypothetical protein
LTNSTGTPCSLRGYPGVSNVTSSGAQIGAAADRAPGAPTTVVLAAGGSTTATLIEASTGVMVGCDQPSQTTNATALRVYPPNDTQPLLIARTATVCSSPSVHQLSVTAVGVHP